MYVVFVGTYCTSQPCYKSVWFIIFTPREICNIIPYFCNASSARGKTILSSLGYCTLESNNRMYTRACDIKAPVELYWERYARLPLWILTGDCSPFQHLPQHKYTHTRAKHKHTPAVPYLQFSGCCGWLVSRRQKGGSDHSEDTEAKQQPLPVVRALLSYKHQACFSKQALLDSTLLAPRTERVVTMAGYRLKSNNIKTSTCTLKERVHYSVPIMWTEAWSCVRYCH